MDTPNSLIIKKIAVGFIIYAFLWGPSVSAQSAAETKKLTETIQYLLNFVRSSECRFYRNNKEHTAVEAADHMQRKYAHFKDEIKSPQDFIRLTATKSLMTGKLYYVKLKDGKTITSEAWLLQALEDYRKQPK